MAIPPIKDLSHLRGNLRHNEPLSKHTTWRVGGPAEWFYEPADLEDLMQFMRELQPDQSIFWLGLGSNLLVRDGGIRGITILTAGLLNEISVLDKNCLHIEAGVSCAKVARFATRSGLGGLEFLAGIPGTFGGALAMNAGAFGGDTWALVRSVETLDKAGEHHHRSLADYEISYRSVKGPKNEWFIAATLQLHPNIDNDVQTKIRALIEKRNKTQPIGLPSCGSVFRNPPDDYAARLIEEAGWKGFCEGNACVSEKHANFIINQGSATARDIENLILKIQASIKEKYNIELIPEVHIVGESITDNE